MWKGRGDEGGLARSDECGMMNDECGGGAGVRGGGRAALRAAAKRGVGIGGVPGASRTRGSPFG